ncbi:MAG: L-aspartate oxidase [Lactobacillales bacterium]|jgi:L-aspartate oxidase|nr:L-aspartate oxidase [Lactobacillales bacterium]
MKKRVLIVGSGLAGSFLALLLQDKCEVILLTKSSIKESNSMLAQGGIAAVMTKKDSFASHIEDTLVAGKFHNDSVAVKTMIEEGPLALLELTQRGFCFDMDKTGAFSSGMEGAHSKRRVLHSKGDQTGREVTFFVQSLWKNVKVIESAYVVEVLKTDDRVVGVFYLDKNDKRQQLFADDVVLATGGIGNLFPFTSNDATITGDGLALAKRAGAQLKDLEFIQFHPTILSVNGHCCGLLSEAIRGEGGRFVNDIGEYFMEEIHPLKDLAPRDIMSREVYQQVLLGRKVFLDISKVENFKRRFPSIAQNLIKHGFLVKENQFIPIQPGAHFLMGGVKTDLFGVTNVSHLYALGEVACSGVHGANRLASNSLLEILVFAKRMAKKIVDQHVEDQEVQQFFEKDEEVCTMHANLPSIQELKTRMWESLGIVREASKIEEFLAWLASFSLSDKIHDNSSREEIGLRNFCLIAQEIAKSALIRKESLGAHFIKGE